MIRTLFCILFCVSVLYAQTPRQNDILLKYRVANRINLNEKANRMLKLAPRALLSALCKGEITGYYPNTENKVIRPEVFATAFHTNCGGNINEFACCNTAININVNTLKETYPEFEYIIEVMEEEIFDKQTSNKKYIPRFLRLVWIDPQGVLPAKNAVIFKYDEKTKTLLESLKVSNPQNDAAQLSIKQILELRLYDGYSVEINGYEPKTIQEAEQKRDQRIEKVQDIQNK